jgi:hypothetical protein
MSEKAKKKDGAEQRRERIRELQDRIMAISGSAAETYISPECTDRLAEQFLKSVLEFECAEEMSLSQALTAGGIALPPADTLDDRQLSAKLWEVIRAMSLYGHYLTSTDHLSDRELYQHLREKILPEPTVLRPENPNYSCQIDLVISGSDEDNALYLKYYADEESRRQWSEDYPGDSIPQHEDPPYDRDRHLPRIPGW